MILLWLVLVLPVEAYHYVDPEEASVIVVKSENQIEVVNLMEGRRCLVPRTFLSNEDGHIVGSMYYFGFLLCKIPTYNADLKNPLAVYCITYHSQTNSWNRPNWGNFRFDSNQIAFNHYEERISNVNLCVVGNVTMIFVITIESRKEERYSRVVFIGVRSVPNEVSTIYSYKDDGHLVRRGENVSTEADPGQGWCYIMPHQGWAGKDGYFQKPGGTTIKRVRYPPQGLESVAGALILEPFVHFTLKKLRTVSIIEGSYLNYLVYYLIGVNLRDREFGCGSLNRYPLAATFPYNMSDPILSDFNYLGFSRGIGVFHPDSEDIFSLYLGRINPETCSVAIAKDKPLGKHLFFGNDADALLIEAVPRGFHSCPKPKATTHDYKTTTTQMATSSVQKSPKLFHILTLFFLLY